MHSSDDYAILRSELEDTLANKEELKDLVFKVLQIAIDLKGDCPGSLLEWEREAKKVLDKIYNRPFDTNKRVRKVTGYFNIGTYKDKYPGELLIYAGKQGDETHGWVDSFGRLITMLLQYGVSPQEIYSEFKGVEFKPNGITNLQEAPFCKSIIDMIMKYMEANFIPTRRSDNDEDNDYFALVDNVTDQEK